MKIRNKLIVYFLVILLVPVSVLSFVLYQNSQMNLENQIVKNLETIVDVRKNEIEQFIQNNINIVKVIADTSALTEVLAHHNGTSTKELNDILFTELGDYLRSLKGVTTISLIDYSGMTIATTDVSKLGEDVSKEQFFVKGVNKSGAYFINKNGTTTLSFVTPVYSDGKTVGVVRSIVGIDSFEKIIKDRTGLATTAEVIFAIKDENNNPQYIIQRQYDSQAISGLDDALPINDAISGQEKVMNPTNDYRGIKVIAVTRHIKDFNAGLVVKVDRSEANAPLKNELTTTIVVSLFGILFTILVAWFLSDNFSAPIKQLTEITKKVSENNLKIIFSKDLLESPDEIGTLSTSFKSMIDSLFRAHEDVEGVMKNLRKSEGELSNAQILGRIGNWDWDIATDTITWSKEYYSIFGLDPKQRPPKYEEHLKVYTPESAKRLDAAVKKNMQTGEAYNLDLEIANPKGLTRWITARSETRYDAEGKIVGLRGTAQDITERKQDEERLKELDKLKDDFLSVTTHELKTPLIPIKSQSQLLLAGDYGKLNQKQKAAIEMIYRNEEALNILSGEVLDITKIKSNKLRLILERADIGKIIIDVVNGMKDLVEKKHLTLLTPVFTGIPEVLMDGVRIRQVVSNLVENAIKFTPEHGTISIEMKKIGQNVVVRVKDSGIGLSNESLAKLFTPFFQVESDEARKYRGTGLGLAISKGFVEAHGGTIRAESKGEGKGSTFIFTLPVTAKRTTEIDDSV